MLLLRTICLGILLPTWRYDSGRYGNSLGGNINPDGVSMFEPIGGSAQNILAKMLLIRSQQYLPVE